MNLLSRVLFLISFFLIVEPVYANWVYAGKFVCTEPGQCQAACMDMQATDWHFQDPLDTSGVTCECRCFVPGRSQVSIFETKKFIHSTLNQ